eukprot:gene8959-9887_t
MNSLEIPIFMDELPPSRKTATTVASLDSLKATNNAPNWEDAKENVLPSKKGRSIKTFKDNLLASKDELVELKTTEEGFMTSLSSTSDPREKLSIYCQLVKWARKAFPHNASKLKEVLEKCTTELKHEKSLYNDERYVALWIEYADLVRDQAEIFSFLYTNKIGERLALFWIAWAYVAEKDGNSKAADQIFQKGLKRLAEPKETIQKRYHQFQRRMARQFLNGSMSATTNSEEVEPPKKRPVALRDTSSSQSTDQRQTTNNSVPSRSKAPTQSSSQTQSSLASTTFQIFDDNAAPASAVEGEWKCLGTEKERKKENNGPVMKWNEVTLPSSNSALLAQSSAPLSIPIFVDEEFGPPVAAKQSTNKGSAKCVPIFSDTQVPPKPVASAPVPKSKTQKPAPPAVPAKPANNEWLSQIDSLLEEDMNDGTINTRLARKDIDMMFQSPGETQKRGQPIFQTATKLDSMSAFKSLSCIKPNHDSSVDHLLHGADPSFLHLESKSSAFESLQTSSSTDYEGINQLASRRSLFRSDTNPFNNKPACLLNSLPIVRTQRELESKATVFAPSVASSSTRISPTSVSSESYWEEEKEEENEGCNQSKQGSGLMSNGSKESRGERCPPPRIAVIENDSFESFVVLHAEHLLTVAAKTWDARTFYHHLSSSEKPAVLGFKAQYKTKAFINLPGLSKAQLLSSTGRGSFGHTILLETLDSGALHVLKVGTKKAFTQWEAIFHTVLRNRIKAVGKDNPDIVAPYHRFILKPSKLYSFEDASCLLLPYAELGTLIDVIAVLSSPGLFTSAEHEYLVAYLTEQMASSLRVLHSCGVLHCDIKTDNWVVRQSTEGLDVCLIDFGKARLASSLHSASASRVVDEAYLLAAFTSTLQNKRGMSTEVIRYTGSVSAKEYNLANFDSSKEWLFQPDYSGLCSCMHQLLFFDHLTVTRETAEKASSRGLQCHVHNDSSSSSSTDFWIPKASLRRYWYWLTPVFSLELFAPNHITPNRRKASWSSIYYKLLNKGEHLESAADLRTIAELAQAVQVDVIHKAQDGKAIVKKLIDHLSIRSRKRSFKRA